MPEGLINLLTTGEFVLFLGAGVGVEAGFPTWEGALIEIADQLRPHNAPYADLICKEARAGRFLQAAELLQLAGVPETDRAKMLQAVFDREPQITRRLKLLALTRCQGIVTTNFDRSLPIAAAEAQAQLTVYGESDQDLAAARVANRPFLVRLHGRSEVPETLIFADRHYRSVVDRGPYVEFFRELFVQRNIVFFGFSFSDPTLFGLVQSMSAAVRSLFRRQAFALMAAPVDPKLAQTLVDCGVKIVEYDPADHHAEAWDLFAQYRNGPPAVTPEVYEAQQIRSHLAAAYARARGREFRADRERMLSALMLPVLAEYGQNTVVSLGTC